MKMWIVMCFMAIACAAIADSETDRIRAIIELQRDAWNRGDLAGFVQFYDKTGMMVFITGEEPIRIPADLQKRYEKRYGSSGKDFGKLNFSEIQVELLSDQLARAYGKWSVTQDSKTSSGWFSLLWRKEDGNWLIIHDHSS